MRIVEKNQLMTATEIDRTVQRLAHEIVEKSGGTANLALIGVRRRTTSLASPLPLARRGIDGVEGPRATLDITLYRDQARSLSGATRCCTREGPTPVDDKDLVLVDD